MQFNLRTVGVFVFLLLMVQIARAQIPKYERGPYLTYDELTEVVEDAAEQYPGLVRVESLVESRGGRDVWLVEIAGNRGERPLSQRPAFLGNGTLHATELAGTNQCVNLLNYLVEHYGSDPRVTRILDEQVVYLVPRVAIDGAEHVVTTGELIRSRKVDVKERDVPYPEDLNGDGKITRMRWKDPDGSYKLSPEDSRVLIPREAKDIEGPFYEANTEGIIHAWDGETVGSSRTRVDFNRTFPANWEPFYRWIGHGRYPLAEPETKALADFVLAHPNIVAAADYHTGNPAVWHPAGVVEERATYASDVSLYQELGQIGVDLTGFPYIAGYRMEYIPLPGFYIDWLYEQQGILAYTIELGLFYNYLEDRDDLPDEGYNSLRMMQWHDEHPDRNLFIEWETYDHSQLGTVEIGGWNEVLQSNPPPAALDSLLANATQFALEQMEHVPRLEIENARVERLGSDLFKVSAAVRNTGKVGTSITRRGRDTHVDAGINVELGGAGEISFVTGKSHQVIGHLDAYVGEEEMEWVVRTDVSSLTLEAFSSRGLHAAAELDLTDR